MSTCKSLQQLISTQRLTLTDPRIEVYHCYRPLSPLIKPPVLLASHVSLAVNQEEVELAQDAVCSELLLECGQVIQPLKHSRCLHVADPLRVSHLSGKKKMIKK